MTIVKIDPVNRIEGHLALVLVLDGSNKVTNVKAKGAMFRGWENILVGRQPWDPMVLCQRI